MCYTGVIPTHPAARGGKVPPSEAGPGSSCRELEWVGWGLDGRTGTAAGTAPGYHPFGARSVPVGPPCTQDPWNAASWPIRARFQSYSLKVSQNRRVSPKYVHKASHSPYFQNGLHKSPLGFLRFPYFSAFSPKELMGHFRPYLRLLCQNDEVSLDVHTMLHAKWSSDTPTDDAASRSCHPLLI